MYLAIAATKTQERQGHGQARGKDSKQISSVYTAVFFPVFLALLSLIFSFASPLPFHPSHSDRRRRHRRCVPVTIGDADACSDRMDGEAGSMNKYIICSRASLLLVIRLMNFAINNQLLTVTGNELLWLYRHIHFDMEQEKKPYKTRREREGEVEQI